MYACIYTKRKAYFGCGGRALLSALCFHALDSLGFVVDFTDDFGLVEAVHYWVLALCDVYCKALSQDPLDTRSQGHETWMLVALTPFDLISIMSRF